MKARLLLIAVVAFAAMAFSGSVCAQTDEVMTESSLVSYVRATLLADYSESELAGMFPKVKEEAEMGKSMKSESLLASMYLTGIGTSQNFDEAKHWYASARDGGDKFAMYIWGILSEYGLLGVSKNMITGALPMYTGASRRGFAPAQYRLAFLEHNSRDASRRTHAIYWMKQAAEQDYKDAKLKVVEWTREISEKPADKVSAPSAPATGSSTRTSGTAAGSSTRASGATPPTSERTSGTTAASTASRASATGSSSSSSNTSGYSSYSSGGSSSYYSYKRPFNTLDEIHPVGISVGYVQKYWSFESESGSSTFGYWDDSENIKGVQAGLRIEPQFKYGFALDTGLYYEFYYSESKPQVSDDIRFRPSFEEHSLYLPVHLEYRLNFSDNFQIFIYGGVGLDYSLSDKIKSNSEDIYYEDEEAYDRAIWRKFNASYEAGAGIAVSRVQLNFTTAKSFLSMEDEADGVYRLNKGVSVSLSYMF